MTFPLIPYTKNLFSLQESFVNTNKEKVVVSSVSLTGNGLLQNGGTAVEASCE